MVAYIHSNEERLLHASTLGIIQPRWGKSTPLEFPSGFVEGREVGESAIKGLEDGSAVRGVDARRDVKVDRPWPGWAIGSCHAVGTDRWWVDRAVLASSRWGGEMAKMFFV